MKSWIERFFTKVQVSDDGCWLWTAYTNPGGYGQMRGPSGKTVLAHRIYYEYMHGSIPPGLTLDHKCRVRNCVNPRHLEPVTRGENVLRGVAQSALNKHATHCIHGHEFSLENTYVMKNGHRHCRKCRASRERARRARLQKTP